MNNCITPGDAKYRFECPICFCVLHEPILTRCGHKFCKQCIQQSSHDRLLRCPLDNTRLNNNDIFPDNYTKAEIEHTFVICIKNCTKKVPLVDYDNHIEACVGKQPEPSSSTDHMKKLFVSSFHDAVDETFLKAYFEQWGTVVDVSIPTNKQTNQSMGYGFITYADKQMVDNAQNARPHCLGWSPVKSRRVFPGKESYMESKNSAKSIFVPVFGDEVPENDVKEYFSKFGEVVDVSTELKQDFTGIFRNVITVEFEDYDVADKMFLAQKHKIGNSLVYVTRSTDPLEISKIECLMAEEELLKTETKRKLDAEAKTNYSVNAEEAKRRFKCPACVSILRAAVLTRCGHKICAICVQTNYGDGKKFCPVDKTKLSENDIFPDNHTRREIDNTLVQCMKNCGTQVPLLKYHIHFDICTGKKEQMPEVDNLKQLFISTFDKNISEKHLKDYFSVWGTVENVFIPKDKITDRSKGFAFITFSEREMVDNAQNGRPHVIGNKKMKSRRVFPNKISYLESKDCAKSVYVPVFEEEILEADVNEYFSKFGLITRVSPEMKADFTGELRKVITIEFEDYDVADKVFLTQNHYIMDTLIHVLRTTDPYELSKIESIMAEQELSKRN